MSSERTLDSQDTAAEEKAGDTRVTMEMLHAVDGGDSLSMPIT